MGENENRYMIMTNTSNIVLASVELPWLFSGVYDYVLNSINRISVNEYILKTNLFLRVDASKNSEKEKI